MLINENPFYKLNISPSDSRRRVVSKQDELEFMMDSETVSESINMIINPTKRLAAELSWFVFASNDTIATIRQCIDTNQTIPTGGLLATDLINAILYNLGRSSQLSPGDMFSVINIIDEQYAYLNKEKLCEFINEKRQIAGMQSVTEDEADNELKSYKDTIRQVMVTYLERFEEDTYIDLCTSVAEKYKDTITKRDCVILRDIIDQYEIKMQPKVDGVASDIIRDINSLGNISATGIDDYIDRIIDRLKAWDRYAQPIQLRSFADGTVHDTSNILANRLSDLTYTLNKRRNRTDAAIKLNDSMKEVFIELPEMVDSFEAAGKELEEIEREREEAKRFEDAVVLHHGEDKVYEIKLRSAEYTMPQYCACCMHEFPPITGWKKTYTAGKRIWKSKSNTVSVDVPVCSSCKDKESEHRNKYYKFDVIALIIAWIVTNFLVKRDVSGGLAWFVGAIAMFAAFFIVAYFTEPPYIDKKQVSRNNYVRIILPSSVQANEEKPFALGFAFKNWHYAQLFIKQNGANIVSYEEKDEKNNLNAKNMLSAGFSYKAHLIGILVIGIMIASLICDEYDSKKSNTNNSEILSESYDSEKDVQTQKLSDEERVKQENWVEQLDEQKKKIEEYKYELTSMSEELEKMEEQYFDGKDDSIINKYNELVEQYNTMYNDYSAAVDSYNKEVEAYNEYYGLE